MVTPASGFGGLTERFDLNKPVIAAVNGAAFGGGFEIVLACDIVIAAENAVFALPEVKVGLAALAGGLFWLPREIGMKQAMGMLLTGRPVSAQEGKELGFVNEVADGDFLDTARRWASKILECSPMSVRATKDAVHRGYAAPLDATMRDQWGYPMMVEMLGSDDAREGPAAFAEKRLPRWKGR